MYLAWLLFFGIIFLLVFFARVMVKYYIDPTENYKIINWIIIFSFTMSIICVILIPIDVYVVSSRDNMLTTMDIKIDKPFIK
mmetsp:Transcript_9389/g.826  ORF Transcript_9389/g.826 Transcript_9389/m.826 type:complete len:82 (+) Transcript_9389:28-273(+)